VYGSLFACASGADACHSSLRSSLALPVLMPLLDTCCLLAMGAGGARYGRCRDRFDFGCNGLAQHPWVGSLYPGPVVAAIAAAL
jgi:hypothetical protein